jgi:hypothetical protein
MGTPLALVEARTYAARSNGLVMVRVLLVIHYFTITHWSMNLAARDEPQGAMSLFELLVCSLTQAWSYMSRFQAPGSEQLP